MRLFRWFRALFQKRPSVPPRLHKNPWGTKSVTPLEARKLYEAMGTSETKVERNLDDLKYKIEKEFIAEAKRSLDTKNIIRPKFKSKEKNREQ
jgi:hypothetical protein